MQIRRWQVISEAQQTFIQLKFFPRWDKRHGCMDAGLYPTPMRPAVLCVKCGEGLYETASLEFCVACGYVDTDYWGLLTTQDILTTRRHQRK